MLEKSLEIGGYLKGSSRGRVGHDFGHEGRKESLQLVIEPDKKKSKFLPPLMLYYDWEGEAGDRNVRMKLGIEFTAQSCIKLQLAEN